MVNILFIFVIYIVRDAKVEKIIYVASDINYFLSKPLCRLCDREVGLPDGRGEGPDEYLIINRLRDVPRSRFFYLFSEGLFFALVLFAGLPLAVVAAAVIAAAVVVGATVAGAAVAIAVTAGARTAHGLYVAFGLLQ